MKKVADSNAIQKAKDELVEKIKAALDLTEIRQILEEQHALEISDDISVNRGQMVIHDNKIAYKMEFEVLLSLSVLLDGEGNYIPTEEGPEKNIEQVGNEVEGLIEDM